MQEDPRPFWFYTKTQIITISHRLSSVKTMPLSWGQQPYPALDFFFPWKAAYLECGNEKERWPSDKSGVCCVWWNTGKQSLTPALGMHINGPGVRLVSPASFGVNSTELGTSITQSQVLFYGNTHWSSLKFKWRRLWQACLITMQWVSRLTPNSLYFDVFIV